MMRRPERRLVVAGALALVVVALVFVAATGIGLGSPEHHADGAGPLGSLRGGVTTLGMEAPVEAGDRMSFGLELCIVDGPDPAIIEAIRPTAIVGSGVTYLGALLRENDRRPSGELNTMAGGVVRGFPPPDLAPASMVEAVGATVTNRCVLENQNHITELILGFESDGAASGGWRGVDVAYRAGWRHRLVSLRYDFLLCLPTEPECRGVLLPE